MRFSISFRLFHHVKCRKYSEIALPTSLTLKPARENKYAKNIEELERSLENKDPSIDDYRQLIKFSGMSGNLALLEKWSAKLTSVAESEKIDLNIMSALVSSYAHCGNKEKTLFWIDQIRSSKLKLFPRTTALIIVGLGNSQELDRLKDFANSIDPAEIDSQIITALIMAFAKAGDSAACLAWIENIKKFDLLIDKIGVSKIITALADLNDYANLKKWCDRLDNSKFDLDVSDFNCIFSAFRKVYDRDLVAFWVKNLDRYNVKPRAVTFECLFSIFEAIDPNTIHEHDAALFKVCLGRFEHSKVKPMDGTFAKIIKVYGNLKDDQNVDIWVQKYLSSELAADGVSEKVLMTIVDAYRATNNAEKFSAWNTELKRLKSQNPDKINAIC